MSEVFWVSYRIVEDSSYQTRYNELIDRINRISSHQWDYTTSFHIIESGRDIETIFNRLTPALNKGDYLLIRRLNEKTALFFGYEEEFNELREFMPYVSR